MQQVNKKDIQLNLVKAELLKMKLEQINADYARERYDGPEDFAKGGFSNNV